MTTNIHISKFDRPQMIPIFPIFDFQIEGLHAQIC